MYYSVAYSTVTLRCFMFADIVSEILVTGKINIVVCKQQRK